MTFDYKDHGKEKLHYYPDFLGDEMDIAKGFTNKIIDFLDKEG